MMHTTSTSIPKLVGHSLATGLRNVPFEMPLVRAGLSHKGTLNAPGFCRTSQRCQVQAHVRLTTPSNEFMGTVTMTLMKGLLISLVQVTPNTSSRSPLQTRCRLRGGLPGLVKGKARRPKQ